MTSGPKIGEHLLFLWGLSRMTPTQVLNLEIDEIVPGFSTFCAGIGTLHQSNEIGYLPLILSSPTDPGVVKTAMMNLVRLAETIGMTHTVITCDQAIYEIAYTLREQYPEEFANVVLMLGGFHLAHNFLKAITKIMRGSGAEDILIAAKVFLQGTANKSFGDRGDYYQSLHGLTILYEVMLRLRCEAIENWRVQYEIDTQCLEHLMETLKDLNTCDSQQELMDLLDRAKPSLYGAENLTSCFREAMDAHPTQKLWSTFLEMVGILLCFICAQREGNWQDYLEQADKILPFLISACHYKYGSYLSLHLKEMKALPQNAPSIYEHFEQGEFTVRRARGRHNGVSPDMVLEQTYNAEVKQKQGLCGITLEPKAQTKWLYTKPVVAEVAGKLRRMLHMEPSYDKTPEHHESGTSIVQKDALAVQSCLQVIATQMVNPFLELNPDSLVCISNGAQASKETQRDLTQLKAIREKAFLSCLEKGGDKLSVKLSTFDSTHSKKSTGKEKSKVSAEINVLQRVSQVIAAGEEVHIEKLVGEHECPDIPPSLFDTDGSLRKGNNSTLVKVILEDTQVRSVKTLPDEATNTAVIVDAMYSIHRWAFRPGEKFQDVEKRYKSFLLHDIPPNTSSVHFCCDRYDHEPSLKAMKRTRCTQTSTQKLYDIQNHLPTPAFREFV